MEPAMPGPRRLQTSKAPYQPNALTCPAKLNMSGDLANMTRTRQQLSWPAYVELWQALDPELQNCFHADGCLSHPLIIEPIVNASLIPYINEAYRKKKAHAQQDARDGNWPQLILIYARPYRIKALRKALRHINDPKEAVRLVGEVWTDSENIRQDRSVWLSIWTKLAEPWAAMDEKEQAEFATFPNRLTIFRGQYGRRGLTDGLAWTTDQSKAEWFARRFPHRGPPFVASGRVFKHDVFAYFIGRQESEIVVSPDRIRDVVVTKLLPLPPLE
jgi:hypothetical protein